MSEEYLQKLKTWGLYAAAVVAVSLLSALVQRLVGVSVDVPPPPPITVVVQPADGAPPTVTVFPTPGGAPGAKP